MPRNPKKEQNHDKSYLYEYKPRHIDPNCPKCGASLILSDLLRNPDIPEKDIWADEFECPDCRDGIYLDWPKKKLNALRFAMGG